MHQPLASEVALAAAQAEHFRSTERAALAGAARVVATSDSTARILTADYAVPPRLVSVVRPGSDRVPVARGSCDRVVRLVSVGSVVPGKGYDILISALASLPELPWRLTIAGDRTRCPSTAAQLDADIHGYGLENRVDVLGALSPQRVTELYLASDLFVLASHFEGYGMALAEAIAHGLPVVSTKAGAIPDTLPAGAALLVAPGDVTALAQALRELIGDPLKRRRLASNACAAAVELPTWEDSARRFAGAIESTR